jgi:hypothetical protein
MKSPTDTQLHELARKRVSFRVHLIVYFVTNAAFWIIWFVTGRGYVWPVWPMVGWGIGVVFHYSVANGWLGHWCGFSLYVRLPYCQIPF